MSDELILELIAPIKCCYCGWQWRTHAQEFAEALVWAASIVAARGNDDNFGTKPTSSFATDYAQ